MSIRNSVVIGKNMYKIILYPIYNNTINMPSVVDFSCLHLSSFRGVTAISKIQDLFN